MNQIRDIVCAYLLSYSVKIATPGREFKLASGGQSRLYIDAKKTVLHRSMHSPVSTLLLDAVAKYPGIDGVAGVVLGGCHLASLVATRAAVRGELLYNVVYVRKGQKNHGTEQVVESPWSRFGESVVLIEDVLSTGASARSAVRALADNGFEVRAVVTLIDRRLPADQTDRLASVPLKAIFTLDDLGITADVAAIQFPDEGPWTDWSDDVGNERFQHFRAVPVDKGQATVEDRGGCFVAWIYHIKSKRLEKLEFTSVDAARSWIEATVPSFDWS